MTVAVEPDDLFEQLAVRIHDEWREMVAMPKSVLRRNVETVLLVGYGLTCAVLAVAYERLEDAAELIRPRKKA